LTVAGLVVTVTQPAVAAPSRPTGIKVVIKK
jgi:hypothetical protein